MRRIIVVAAVGLVGTGCYTYVPADLEQVSVGTEVRAHLSDAAVQRFRATGFDREAIDGLLARHDSDHIVVEAKAPSTGFDPYNRTPLRQPINLTPQDIVAVSVRRLHQTRTIAAVGLGTAAAATLVTGMIRGWFGGGEEEPGEIVEPDPEALRVPFRIRLGW